ncbi:histidine kinase dimerization/phospho-acceptor domain-containing protein [Blastococcus brunescens]|uniref:histidine kinase n=1 Tax=Blastococcus brunescens TaxID=1564165 RepID=A0ABZ1B597_9ACTN|nr:histidine kinase dimerization/phospho-acceptor domain-containing protein [Blastococcus sp. BMG 8361]WRL65909.1 histidine kinase dimerization/phospho-acceptor domain-containing protein [Blastococcus sp. BMG 8361]
MTPVSRLPISARLALLSAASLSALLALVGIVVYQQLGAGLRAGIDQQLADLAGSLPPRLAEDGFPEEADDDEFDQLELSDRLIQLVDQRGQLIAASDDADSPRPLLERADLDQARDGDAVLRTVPESADEDDPLRVLAVPYGDEGLVAVLAAELDEVQDAQRALVAVYGPVALLGVAVAGLLGYVIARRGLAPVRRMTDEAEDIGGSDLSRRLSAPGRLDEVGRLARTLNGMLTRLDAAIGRERAFTADASHELRTPLAILRAEIELARDRAHDLSIQSALDTALEEAARLSGLVDDLLVLARADSGDLEDHRPVDLDELVDVVIARFTTLASRRGVRLESTGVAVVRGDFSGLERALANLVDNALRHTPGGASSPSKCARSVRRERSSP